MASSQATKKLNLGLIVKITLKYQKLEIEQAYKSVINHKGNEKIFFNLIITKYHIQNLSRA